MNKYLKQLLACTLLTSSLHILAGPFDKRDTYGKPFFAARSQGQNLARRLVNEVNELVPCLPCMNGVLSITPAYSRTFNSDAIGRYFSFRRPCPDLCSCDDIDNIEQPDTNIMSFRGAAVEDRTDANTDVLADNFLLASTFDGLVELNPQVKNVILDINWRANLDGITKGLYLDVGVPVVWTHWNMGLAENTVNQAGNIIIQASEPNIDPFRAPAPVTSIIEAWRGQTDGTLTFESETDGQNPIEINIEPMRFARINGSQKKRGVADVHFVIGRNFVCTQDSHLGVNFRVIAPTGTKPQGEFVFEPIVGNGHHVGLGVGMSAHTLLWQDECLDKAMNIWIDGAVYSLLKTKQIRTFDLRNRAADAACTANGVGSRYLLFKRFQNGTFTNTFVPGPNVTTLPADVSIPVMGEFVALFDYQWYNVTFDIGYNLWGRSKEKITITGTIPENTYGILGGTPIDNNDPGAANRTNSLARINGSGYSLEGDGANPVFITTADLDPKAAQAPSALTNKLFAHIGYTFEGCHYAPFFGIGGEVEFSGIRNNAFNQWSVWGKIGFAYS